MQEQINPGKRRYRSRYMEMDCVEPNHQVNRAIKSIGRMERSKSIDERPVSVNHE